PAIEPLITDEPDRTHTLHVEGSKKSRTSTISTISTLSTCSPHVCVDWRRVRELARCHRPNAVGQRNHKLFLFAQAVKGLSEHLDAKQLYRAFRFWWKRARKVVETKDADFNLAAFIHAYDHCRSPGGFDWVEVADKASRDPLPPQAEGRCSKGWARLIRA